MSSALSASVGRWERRARNRPADVEVVQRLLETAAYALQAPKLDPKGVVGKIAHPPSTSNTVAAIKAFQGRYTTSVDGLIKPESQTWHERNEWDGVLPLKIKRADVTALSRDPIATAVHDQKQDRQFRRNSKRFKTRDVHAIVKTLSVVRLRR